LEDGFEPAYTSFDDKDDHPIRRKRKRNSLKNDTSIGDHIKIKHFVTPKKRKPVKKTPAAAKESKNDLFSFPQGGPRDLQMAYQCQRCVRGFNKVSDYRQHFRRHDMEKEDMSKAFICLRCMDFEAPEEKLITKHCRAECPVTRHDDTNSKFTYFCVFCEVVFDTSNSFERHLEEKHPIERKKFSRAYCVCQACGKEFKDFGGLKKHKIYEGPLHTCRCMECKIDFDCWTDLSHHILKMHDNKVKYWCGFCGINSFESEDVKNHHKKFCKVQSAVGPVKMCSESMVICTICGAEVEISFHKVKSHLKEYHSEFGMKCDLCEKIFFDEGNLQDHYNSIHVNNSRYACDMCEKAFPNKNHLKVHKEKAHPLPGKARPLLKCELCDASYTNKYTLATHHMKKHSDAPPIQKTRVCEVCGETLQESYYATHMDRMHKVAKMPCTVCGKLFQSEKILKQHMALHVTVTCEVCGLECPKAYYKRHMTAKHGAEDKRPFFCSTCQKGFMSSQSYQTHMNGHTGERPFKCKFCDRSFADSSNRSKHMKQAHQELLPKKPEKILM